MLRIDSATKNLGRGADSPLGASHGPNLPRFFAALKMTSVKSILTQDLSYGVSLVDVWVSRKTHRHQ